MEYRLARYHSVRRKFSAIVYVSTGIFLVLAIVQWALALEIYCFSKFFTNHFYVSPCFLLCALFLITFFVMFEELRFIAPLNWILSVLIIECIIWGVARIAISGNAIFFYVCLAAVFLFCVLIIILGNCMTHDLTLDILVICALAGIFIIISSMLLMIYLVTFMRYILIVYAVMVLIVVIMFLMYHSQTITGGRYAEMRLDDFLLAIVILFCDYVLLLMTVYYIVGKSTEYISGSPFFNITGEDIISGTDAPTQTDPPAAPVEPGAPAARPGAIL